MIKTIENQHSMYKLVIFFTHYNRYIEQKNQKNSHVISVVVVCRDHKH